MSSKRFFLSTITTFILAIALYGAMAYQIDPLQQFRNTRYGYAGNIRHLLPGIAKNYDYNIAVLGTSTSQNNFKKDIEALFGKKAMNFGMPGSSNFEQRKMLKLIIKNKNIEEVIYGMDDFSYNYELTGKPTKIEEYLYADTPINKLKYIMNIDILKEVTKEFIRSNFKGKNYDENWRDTLVSWGLDKEYSSEETLEFEDDRGNGTQNILRVGVLKEGYNETGMMDNFYAMKEIIKENPQINFKIFFPPYSSVYWSFAKHYGVSKIMLDFKSTVVKELSSLDNVIIYDFQDDLKVVENLDNYSDIIHYGPQINKYMLELIKEKESTIDPLSYDKRVAKFSKKIDSYHDQYKYLVDNVGEIYLD